VLVLEVVHTSILEINDHNLYDVTWNSPMKQEETVGNEFVILKTKENEEYRCKLPMIHSDENDYDAYAKQPSPEKLMTKLLQGAVESCTFRMEPYWTYSLCHGTSMTQYHEEKDDDGNTKRTEYTLGKMTPDEVQDALKPPILPDGVRRPVPKRKIEQHDTPYWTVTMDNGTPCDLNNKPRSTTVIYVCHPGATNQILSINEVTSCEYEVVALTPLLCENTFYRLKDTPVHDIQCEPYGHEKIRPASLIQLFSDADPNLNFFKRMLFKTENKGAGTEDIAKPVPLPAPTPIKDEPLSKQFLNGDYCLKSAGQAYWRYEFCNGKSVKQFHEEPDGSRVVVVLGTWNKEKHIAWYKKKTRKKSPKYVSHYYSGGDVCDITGEERHARVDLKCKKGEGQELSIYMVEPKTCEYIVGVESPILCDIIDKADDNGLIS